MAITKDQILAEIRKRQEARKIEEAKAAKKPAFPTLLETTKKAAVKPTFVNETRNTNRGPRTITEAISQRTTKFKGEDKKLYTVLAENIAQATRTIYSEATQAGSWTPGAVGNAAGVGLVKTYFDIFFGYFPNLIVQEIASVQPIKTEKAMVFFYQSVAGSDKGEVAKGDVLIDPFKINTDVEYTSNKVSMGKLTYNTEKSVGTWGPVLRVLINGVDFGNTSANDVIKVIEGKNVKANIAISDSAVTVKVTDLDGFTGDLNATYEYSNKYAPTAVPELNANVDSREIIAKARTIKTNYSFQAGFGFEAQFGQTLEDKLAEAAMYQLKRETDLDFVFEVMNAAPALIKWNRAAGVANGLYEFHKLSFLDAVVGASNLIYKKSKRARGNVLLVGPNAQTVVETLPAFNGDNYGSQLGGAKVIGKLKDIKVIAIPELADNDWAVIYKSNDDSLDAGIVFAPYIPVVATPTVMLDDLLARKAYTTSYGKLVVNADYFVRGTITNDPIAQAIQILDKEGEVIEDFTTVVDNA